MDNLHALAARHWFPAGWIRSGMSQAEKRRTGSWRALAVAAERPESSKATIHAARLTLASGAFP